MLHREAPHCAAPRAGRCHSMPRCEVAMPHPCSALTLPCHTPALPDHAMPHPCPSMPRHAMPSTPPAAHRPRRHRICCACPCFAPCFPCHRRLPRRAARFLMPHPGKLPSTRARLLSIAASQLQQVVCPAACRLPHIRMVCMFRRVHVPCPSTQLLCRATCCHWPAAPCVQGGAGGAGDGGGRCERQGVPGCLQVCDGGGWLQQSC